MIFDREKNKLVMKLRKLRGKVDKTEYRIEKKRIAAHYKVTERSVENWLVAKVPGKRKSRSDSGKDRKPIRSKEKKVVKELIENNLPVADVKKIAEEKTGEKISNRKMMKIRKKVEKEEEAEKIEESNFGDKAKEVFRTLFELDLIAPDRGVSMKIDGKKYIIPKCDLEDICLILANAYNRQGKAKYKADRDELLKRKILHLIEQQVRLASAERVDTKTIVLITQMYDKMLEKVDMDTNIKVVENICKELKPDITFTEVISLIKKYSEEK
jgi:hypothetical protein